MSAIASIYNNIRTEVSGLLTTYTEISNAYVPDFGTDLQYRKGWGVALGASNPTNRLASCKFTVNRDFIITLTRKIYVTSTKINERVAEEILLLEDHHLLIKELLNSSLLNSGTTIAKTDFSGDSGIEFIRPGDKLDLIMIQSIFSVEYFEDYN